MAEPKAKRYGLAELVEAEGFQDSLELAETFIHESIVPAICTKCGYTTEYEPDSTRGWCEGCESQSCVSALVLMGII